MTISQLPSTPAPYAATAPMPIPYPGLPYRRPTNGLAIACLITALCGLVIVPIILGHVALRQIPARGEDGAGLAWAGLILGWLQFALITVFLIATAVGAWWLWTS